jgi:hypothetical protein
MYDPDNTIEYFRAEMPDGRLLMIARERSPRLSPLVQTVFTVLLALGAPALLMTLLLTTSIFTFAGPWSSIPIAAGSLALFIFGLIKACDWASSPPRDPERCKVVGMDLSTDELMATMRGEPAPEFNTWSVH